MIQKKLLELQKKEITTKKDGKANYGKYLTLDSVVYTYAPELSKLNVVIFHETKNAILTTYLFDTEDDTMVSSEFQILNTDPQKRGGEITYGKRYNLGQLLNVTTETDDDGKSSSGDNFKKEEVKNWLNYESFLSIVEAGNTSENQIAQIIKEDGYILSNQAKIAVRHYCDTGEIEKNLFFKSPK